MQKIDGTTIKVNRGDVLNLILTLTQEDGTPYIFQVGDKIVFSIYKKNKMSEKAVLLKEVNVNQEAEALNINLSREETKIEQLINRPVEYWYEIELNEQYTVLGYDDNGAKIFMLYPEGSQINE